MILVHNLIVNSISKSILSQFATIVFIKMRYMIHELNLVRSYYVTMCMHYNICMLIERLFACYVKMPGEADWTTTLPAGTHGLIYVL